MRSYATFFVIAVLTLGLITLIASKAATNHAAPAEEIEPAAAMDGGVEGGTVDASAGALIDASASVNTTPLPTAHPLRVAALGWENIAAGAALAGPDGKIVPAVELAPESALDAIEARLARGGSDPQGADVAVLPLPAFVVAYERLRALEPRAFLVVGFSHGREEVRSAAGALNRPPPADEEVKLVAFSPASTSDPSARAWGSESATVVGAFALDLLGVAPSRLRLLSPDKESKAAPFAALVRGAADERKLAFSTADASRLVPIVAIAPKTVVEGRTKDLSAFAASWLDGIARAGKDAPAVARRLASKDNLPFAGGVGGAPEALHLVERLGQLEGATPDSQNAMFVGTTAVTLATLTQRTWSLARGVGLTSTVAPDPLPLDPRVAKSIAPPPTTPAKASGEGTIPAHAMPLLVYRETARAAAARPADAGAAVAGDTTNLVAQIGFLAGVFERAVFRVSVKGGEKAAKAAVDQAIDRYNIAPNRLGPTASEPTGGAFATVEILSPP